MLNKTPRPAGTFHWTSLLLASLTRTVAAAALAAVVGSVWISDAAFAADEPVFSGPQTGEPLPGLKVSGVFGEQAGEEFDLIEATAGKPLVLFFVHARTRPAFGLTNTVMRYATSRREDGLRSGVVFLTDDPTATEQWMKVVEKYFPKGAVYAISKDGPEGPGAYGLNRNVTLTVLVAKDNQVTANFALVQPSLPVDGPKILQAIVDQVGGEAPDVSTLRERR